MQKKYVRVVITTGDDKIIKEKWRLVDEERQSEYAFLQNLSSCLRGEQGYIKLTTRSGDIEVIPYDILKDSHYTLEYSRFGL